MTDRAVAAVVRPNLIPIQTVHRPHQILAVGDVRLPNHQIETKMTMPGTDIKSRSIVNSKKKRNKNNLQKLDFHHQPLRPKKIPKQIQMGIPMTMKAAAKAVAIPIQIHQMMKMIPMNIMQQEKKLQITMTTETADTRNNIMLTTIRREHRLPRSQQITIPHTQQTMMKMIPMIRTIQKILIAIIRKKTRVNRLWRRRRRRRRQRPKLWTIKRQTAMQATMTMRPPILGNLASLQTLQPIRLRSPVVAVAAVVVV